MPVSLPVFSKANMNYSSIGVAAAGLCLGVGVGLLIPILLGQSSGCKPCMRIAVELVDKETAREIIEEIEGHD